MPVITSPQFVQVMRPVSAYSCWWPRTVAGGSQALLDSLEHVPFDQGGMRVRNDDEVRAGVLPEVPGTVASVDFTDRVRAERIEAPERMGVQTLSPR